MADGVPPPDWKFRVVDYLALGFILVTPEEIVLRPKLWYLWSATLLAGIAFAYFGDKGAPLWKKIVTRWRASRNLADALTRNESLERENEQLRKNLAAVGESVPPQAQGVKILAKPAHNVQCVGFTVITHDDMRFATLRFQNVPIPGQRIGKFTSPRLRAIYYEGPTGQEIMDLAPLMWEKEPPTQITATESYGIIAVYMNGKWQACEVNEPDIDDPFPPREELSCFDLSPGDYQITARLSGFWQTQIFLPPVIGVLTLRTDATASFRFTEE